MFCASNRDHFQLLFHVNGINFVHFRHFVVRIVRFWFAFRHLDQSKTNKSTGKKNHRANLFVSACAFWVLSFFIFSILLELLCDTNYKGTVNCLVRLLIQHSLYVRCTVHCLCLCMHGNANDLCPFVNCSVSIESIEVDKKVLCGRLVFSQWKRERMQSNKRK